MPAEPRNIHVWRQPQRPLIGLSPMDGVTNAPFRKLTARYGKPDIMYTEFVPVDGLMHNATVLLRDFCYVPDERPVIAQIYGINPHSFYALAHLLCAMGFDGIDINMGCPAKNVAARGAGAGLIRTPAVAQALIGAVKRGITDWCDGQSPIMAGVPADIVHAAQAMSPTWIATLDDRTPIPVSVKTRIGYSANTVGSWIPQLLEAEPAAIALHGRTLQQMYRGSADWEAIAHATELIHRTPTLSLGNGDLQTVEQIAQVVAATKVDGVLVGRAVMGNPWLFADVRTWRESGATQFPERTTAQALTALVEHAQALQAFSEGRVFGHFHRLVKPYTAGLPDSAELRLQLYTAKSADAVERVIRDYAGRSGSGAL